MTHRQMTLATEADGGFEKHRKSTRRDIFLAEMDQVVPWKDLCAQIEPVYPKGQESGGRRPIGLERMLRIHFLQQWYALSDPAVEEALYDSRAMRKFVGIDLGREAVPDETTVCKFRHLLEKHGIAKKLFAAVQKHMQAHGMKLSQGTIVDATIIQAPSSTKNKDGKRDPEMHQTKKGNQWYFGMKAHIGVDAELGVVHTVTSTAANVADINEVEKLLHGNEDAVHADAGYTGADKRAPSARTRVVHRCQTRQGQGHHGRDIARTDRRVRARQGVNPRRSRASVPGDQAPVRLSQGTLPWPDQEPCPGDDAVCPVEPVDGAQANTGIHRIGAPG